MVVQKKLYTVEEFEEYEAQHPDQRFELTNGEIVEKVPTIILPTARAWCGLSFSKSASWKYTHRMRSIFWVKMIY
jgi:Uma2 family endonuclease